VAAERSLHAYADELLAAAQRGEISDAYSQLHEAAERILIGRAFERAQGNQAQAARWLGISRLTLREKLIHFGLHPGREP
jgi:DNA-binding protein Fis